MNPKDIERLVERTMTVEEPKSDVFLAAPTDVDLGEDGSLLIGLRVVAGPHAGRRIEAKIHLPEHLRRSR